MTEGKRVVPSLILHYLVGLTACVALVFSRPALGDLIPPFVFPWKLRTAMALFASYMPALQISGLLVGYALAFSHRADERIDRWSENLVVWLKESFLITLVVLALYVLMVEGVVPVMESRKESLRVRSEDYRDYLAVSRMALINGDPEEASFRIRSALEIWKDSPDALAIAEECGYRLADRDGTRGASETPPALDPLTAGSPAGLTVVSALERARDAERRLDFYNAHYYAMLASRLAKADDPNKDAALRLASNAWNRITQGSDDLRAEGDARLYSAKRQGYESIQSGDYLTAYYLFLSLHSNDSSSGDGKRDPDIERFLDVSRRGVLETFFFIDETDSLRLFESARDVFFTLRRQDGGTDAVFVRGVTYTRAGGNDAAYLRDLEIARFDRLNRLEYRMRVPNAKMFAYSPDGRDPRPELLLRAVDRNRPNSLVGPIVLEGNAPPEDLSVILLDMPYRDVNLIVAANRGPQSMIMADLFRFAERSGAYGFDSMVYLREAVYRLSDPFLMLILSVLALTAGWKYRLGKGVLFKAWWALALPLFPVCSFLVIGVVRYYSGLVIIALAASAPRAVLPLTVALFSCGILASSLYFFAQRSD